MKFLCSHCKAKYQIADEKVAGRTLRMTCRQCKEEIVIRGEATRPSLSMAPVAPSALGAEFQRKVGAGVRASAPPPPLVIDEWHVAIDDVPVGPIRREEVARRIAGGAVGPDSLAWREGLDDWLPVRQIPELAVLLGGPLSLPAPALPVIATQRTEIAPVGGRAGAAPAFSLDDWAPPAVDSGLRELHRSSLEATPRPSGMPSWGVVFAIFGFAFLMSMMTILGARWLSKTEPTAAAPAPVAPVAPTTTPAAPTAEPEAEPTEMVIGLDEIGMDEQAQQGARRGSSKPSGSASSKPKTSSSGRTLTDAERAMLARMGGDTQADLALQGSGSTSTRSSGAQSGGLTSDQLRNVVQKNRKNLQRCYESALRGSGSDDTVRLDVEIQVSPNGNVTSVRTGGSAALPGMKECIERTVKMWRFPSAGDATVTKFPVVFQPGA